MYEHEGLFCKTGTLWKNDKITDLRNKWAESDVAKCTGEGAGAAYPGPRPGRGAQPTREQGRPLGQCGGSQRGYRSL